MNLRASLLRMTGGFASRLVTQLSTLALLVYGARSVGPAEFGEFTLASILLTLVGVALYSGAYEFVLRSDDLPRDAGPAFAVMLLTGGVCSVLMLTTAGLVAQVYRSPNLALMLQLFAIIPLLDSLSAWREARYLRQPEKLERYFGILALRDASALAVGLVLLHQGWGLAALIVYRLSVSVLGWLLFRAVAGPVPRPVLVRRELARPLSFGAGLTGTRVLGFVSANGTDLIIGLFLSPTAVGLYRVASRLLVAVSDVVTQPLVKSAWVRGSAAARKQGDGVAVLQSLQTLTFVLLGGLLGALSSMADPLLPSLLGETWRDAASLVPLIAVALLLRAMGLFVEPLLAQNGLTGQLFKLRLATTTLVLVAVAGGAALGGLPLLLAALVASSGLATLLTWAAALRLVRLPATFIGLSSVAGLAAAAACGAVAWAIGRLDLGPIGQLVAQGLGAGIALLLVIAAFRGQLRRALPGR